MEQKDEPQEKGLTRDEFKDFSKWMKVLLLSQTTSCLPKKMANTLHVGRPRG